MTASNAIGGWWDTLPHYSPNFSPPSYQPPRRDLVVMPPLPTIVYPQNSQISQIFTESKQLDGVWVAYGDSLVRMFRQEVEALRFALAEGLKVRYLKFGEDFTP